MTKLMKVLVVASLLAGAGAVNGPSLAAETTPGTSATRAYKSPARSTVRTAALARRCWNYSAYPFCVEERDYGPFYPARTYYFRYPYYAEPFPNGFWWW
jgi:hypothetical protein